MVPPPWMTASAYILCFLQLLDGPGGDGCPQGWTQGANKTNCYKAIETKLSFMDARKQCQSLITDPTVKVDLATIPDFFTSSLVRLYALNKSNSAYLIGLNDLETEGEFRWIGDNKKLGSVYTPWKEKSPDDGYGGQDHVIMYTMHGDWNDRNANVTPFSSICQIFDVDECENHQGGCAQICNNKVGGFDCACHKGYELYNGLKCHDIDECKEDNGGCEQICRNTGGSFDCACREGYNIDEIVKCKDKDECKQDNGGCDHFCLNTLGGYECLCRVGYKLKESVMCKDVDECQKANGKCNQICNNRNGSWDCSCNKGYRLNGKYNCILIPKSSILPIIGVVVGVGVAAALFSVGAPAFIGTQILTGTAQTSAGIGQGASNLARNVNKPEGTDFDGIKQDLVALKSIKYVRGDDDDDDDEETIHDDEESED